MRLVLVVLPMGMRRLRNSSARWTCSGRSKPMVPVGSPLWWVGG